MKFPSLPHGPGARQRMKAVEGGRIQNHPSNTYTSTHTHQTPNTTPPTQVTDHTHAVLHSAKAQPKGQFAFTAKSAGEYKACFTAPGEGLNG